jgi:hypothetical protein
VADNVTVRDQKNKEHLLHLHQGSDKGGGVVQMVLVDTKRNA